MVERGKRGKTEYGKRKRRHSAQSTKRGDLYRLGEKYQVTVTAILDANPYTDVYQLQEGDEILIPKIPVS